MEYLDYHELVCQVRLAKKNYYVTLHNYESLKTSIISASKPKEVFVIENNSTNDKMLNYVCNLSELEEKLKIAKINLTEKKKELKEQEIALRKSHNHFDVIYVLHFLDKSRYFQIANAINYGNSQYYEFLKQIKTEMRKIEKIYEKM